MDFQKCDVIKGMINMAIMIPDTIKPETRSRGERWLFNRFRRELSDSCYVLHSLGLTTHRKKIWGECDFVILSPHGIFIIEVKSGGIACEKGQWIFIDRYGNKNKKKEGPFGQAVGAMYAVKDRSVSMEMRHLISEIRLEQHRFLVC